MQRLKIIYILLFLSVVNHIYALQLDVLSYDVSIEPDIQQHYIEGSVLIRYKLPIDECSFVLNSGNLEIDSVTGTSIKSFTKHDNKLMLELYGEKEEINELTIKYRGNPTKGLLFDQGKNLAYTVYFTHYWMISNFAVNDKATITLKIHVDKGLNCVANGELMEIREKEEKLVYHWYQSFASPTYTFGFAIGNFRKVENSSSGVKIINYSPEYSPKELEKIFIETPKMISFFEEKSGIKYDHSSYFQVLIGNHYQEMSGFSVLKESYGKQVLKDSTETNLISHELAHQWWGNRITCKSLNHFWLNEAITTYMSAAYNEYRFGQEKYQSDIDAYYKVYEGIKNRNEDRPLVFHDWSNPTSDDRNIVYFKGAYVLHLLRQEIGDKMFWDAIKHYSQKYFDKSVTTKDFKTAFEESSERNLDSFFNEWVF